MEQEIKIINWIKENRNLGIANTSYSVLLFIQKLKPEFAIKKSMSKKK